MDGENNKHLDDNDLDYNDYEYLDLEYDKAKNYDEEKKEHFAKIILLIVCVFGL